jgi:hypothetical protein
LKKILILGSAPDAIRAADFDINSFTSIVAINNAWKITPRWTHSIFPTDFPFEKRPKENPKQTLHTAQEYVPIQNNYGGFLYAGGTMAFTAAYWALDYLNPDLIAFLGCDMVYEGTNTHFYGCGTADPLRVDPSLRSIEAKANRFEFFANKEGCSVVNISEKDVSRLTYQKIGISELNDYQLSDRNLNSTIVTKALEMEKKLDYFVASGKYWKETNRFDLAKIDELDQLWLNCFLKN